MARHYDAFISYSHAADGNLAPAIQRGLHQLARGWNQRRALDVFLDRTGLSADPALWGSIQAAMDEARYFVLLASPESAASSWVNRELAHWLATKSVDSVLPVVTDGVWRWDHERGDFADVSTAVPPALRGAYGESPRHVDMRWARSETDLSLRHSRFRDQIAELAAPIHGVSKDEIEGEDVRRHRSTRRLTRTIGAALVVLTLLATGAGILAVREAERATEQQRRAEAGEASAVEQQQRAESESTRARAREIAAQAELLQNQPDLQMLLHVAALDLDNAQPLQQALFRTLGSRPLQAHWRSDRPPADALLRLSAIDPSGSVAYFSNDEGLIEAWDTNSRQRLAGGVISGLVPSGEVVLERTPSPGSFPLPIIGMAAAAGRVLVSVLFADTIFAWDPMAGTFEPVVEGCSSIARPRPLAISRDGQVATAICSALASDTVGNDLVIVREGAEDLSIPLPHAAGDVALSHDGQRAAVVLDAPHGDTLSNRSQILVFDAATGERLVDVTVHSGGSARAALDAQGAMVALGGFDGSVTLLDLESPANPSRSEVLGAPVSALTFDESGGLLLSGDGAGALARWSIERDIDGGPPLFRNVGAYVAQSRIDALAIVSEDSWISVAPDSIAFWGPTTYGGELIYEAGVIYGMAPTIDGKVAFSAPGSPGELMLVDPANQASATSMASMSQTLELAASADGRRLVSAPVGTQPSEILVWDVQQGRVERAIPYPGGGLVFRLALSPDGTLVAASGFGGVHVFDATSGELVATLEEEPSSQAVGFSPDGSVLAYASGVRQLALWEVSRRETVAEVAVGAPIEGIAFSPDSRRLAVGTNAPSGAIQLFDVERNSDAALRLSTIATYLDPAAGVRGLSFDPSGELLVAGTWDQRLLVLDVAHGFRIAFVGTRVPNSPIAAVVFTAPDVVLTAGSGGVTRYDWGMETLRTAACKLSGRELTDDERRTYLDDLALDPCADQ